jgi:hypothetical protein
MKDEGSDVISVDFHLVGTFPKRLIFIETEGVCCRNEWQVGAAKRAGPSSSLTIVGRSGRSSD